MLLSNEVSSVLLKLNEKLFKPIDVEGDGNCFHRSLFKHDYFSTKHSHRSLCKEFSKDIRDNFKNNSSELHSFLTKYWKSELNYQDYSIKNYLLNVDKNGEWGGTLEAACMCILYGIELIFIKSRTELIVDKHKSSSTVAMYIKFFLTTLTKCSNHPHSMASLWQSFATNMCTSKATTKSLPIHEGRRL
jgi:hypothetical protein